MRELKQTRRYGTTQKITITGISLLLLASVFAAIIILPAGTASASPPHTVITVPNVSDENKNPVCPGFMQCIANIAGLWWAIYTNGTDVFYKTSSDGATWAHQTILFTTGESQVQQPITSLCSDGFRLYFVVATGENTNGNTTVFGFLFGIANANSTITVQGGGSVKTTHQFPTNPTCQATSPNNFNVVVGTTDGVSGNQYVEIWHYNNVAWTNWKTILAPNNNGIWAGMLVLVPNGYIAWYGNEFDTNEFITSATGATWTSPISFHNFNSGWSAATTIGNTIYVSASANDNNSIYLVKCTYPCSSLTSAVALGGLSINNPITGIASDSVATLSIAFCVNTGSAAALQWITSSNAGASWSSVNTESPNPECQGSSGSATLSSLPQIISGNQAVLYVNAGSGSNINVRFDLLATGSSTTSTTSTTTTTSTTSSSSSSSSGVCGVPSGHTGGSVVKYAQGASFASSGSLTITGLTANECLIVGLNDVCSTYGGPIDVGPSDTLGTNFFPISSTDNFATYFCNFGGIPQTIGQVYMTYGTIPASGSDTITFPTLASCLPPFEPCILSYFAMEVQGINSALTFQDNSCFANATACMAQTIQVANPYAGKGILVAIAAMSTGGTSGFKYHALSIGGVQVNDSSAVSLPTQFPFAGHSGVWGEVALGSVQTNIIVTVTKVVACNFYQEQCWWEPTIFYGMYVGLWIVIAASINVRARSLTFVLGAATSYASLYLIQLGELPYPFAIISFAAALVYALRLDGVF